MNIFLAEKLLANFFQLKVSSLVKDGKIIQTGNI